MSCQSSSRTKQTILRGCCNTLSSKDCCNTPSGYDARAYCDCNDTAGSNIQTTTLCSILKRAFVDQNFANSAALYSYLSQIPFTGICGPEVIIGLHISTPIPLGTVTNGRIVVTNNNLSTGQSGLLQASNPSEVCGAFRILA